MIYKRKLFMNGTQIFRPRLANGAEITHFFSSTPTEVINSCPIMLSKLHTNTLHSLMWFLNKNKNIQKQNKM